MQASYWFWIVLTLLCCFAYETLSGYAEKPIPIVEADFGRTQLHISREAREAIENITIPIAVVAVIGPYRSGKSFFLNQLLSFSCEEGFDVGHLHDTTKGVWGTWTEMEIDGARTFVLFLDTEAFESIGKSDVYDDRIFALATVMSSVLIYNLPETIHEADMDRLSFAIELAQEFYGRVKGPDVPFEPAKLLWLIQREFLEGRSVQEVVHDALLNVPNHDGNKHVDMINHIRDSLAVMGDNSTAFSLPQLYRYLIMENEYQSSKFCEGSYTRCADKMDQLHVLKLPSMEKINEGFQQCNQNFERECVGPAKKIYEQQMMKLLQKLSSPELVYYNPVWHVIASVVLNRWAIIVAVAVVVLLLYCRKRRSEFAWLLPLHGGGSNWPKSETKIKLDPHFSLFD